MRKSLTNLLILALVLSLGVPIQAQGTGSTATISVTLPTQYIDGSPLAIGDIAYVTITTDTGFSTQVKVSSTTSATVTTTALVACGSVRFSATVTTTATATYPNATSSPAGPVPYASGITCTPKSPGLTAK